MGKPKCELTGTNGNVFALSTKVSRALKDAGLPNESYEFQRKLRLCNSYDEALRLMSDYVDIN